MSKEIKVNKVIDECGDDCVYYDGGKDIGGGNYGIYCRNAGQVIEKMERDGFPDLCLLENNGGKYR